MSLVIQNRNQLETSGYLFLHQFRPSLECDLVAAAFGDVLKLGSGAGVHELTPLKTDKAQPTSYSGMYGHEAFPFHTDLAHWQTPPRYLMLRCLKGFPEIPTLLIDGLEIAGEIGETSLRRALVCPRRPKAGRLHLMRLLDKRTEGNLLRWDEVFIRAASPLGEKGIENLRLAILRKDAIRCSLVDRGDTLIVDNWRMLHARSPIPEGCESRIIQRAYLGALH